MIINDAGRLIRFEESAGEESEGSNGIIISSVTARPERHFGDRRKFSLRAF